MWPSRRLIGMVCVLGVLVSLGVNALAEGSEGPRSDKMKGQEETFQTKGGRVMWRARHVVGIACVLGVLASLSFTAWGGNLEGLKSDKREVREEAFDRILEQHKDRVQQLIALAAREVHGREFKLGDRAVVEYPWHDTKHLAIILLGDLRAAESVPILLENVEYRNPRILGGGTDEMAAGEGHPWYPATESLIKIGMPSVGPVTEKLGGYAENCLGRRLCLVVLKGILGPRLAKAHLGIAIEEAKDKTARANLKAALEQVESKANADR